MHEGDLLNLIYRRSADLRAAFPQVLLGPGDDCGLVAIDPANPRVLLKTDQLIEHRHFTPATPLDLIARKAIARAVSDIAAMAGAPVAAMAACALPRGFDQASADALFDACSKWARHFNAPLVGGDIASFATDSAPLTLTISIIGVPHPRRGPVLRSTAQPGDHVYITGRVGGSFDHGTGLGRHVTFEPRTAEARWLADTLGPQLHAMMDVSDGLGIDAARLAAASRLQIQLDNAVGCVSETLWRAESPPPHETILRALSDGEDYELLFTAAPSTPLPPTCPVTNTSITRIGRCLAGEPGCYLLLGGQRIDVSRRGWEHT